MDNFLPKEKFFEIRDKLNFAPINAVNYVMVAIDIALLITGCLIVNSGISGYILAQILFAVCFFRSFGMVHECAHGSAFSNAKANKIVGHISSVMGFLPFYPWKYVHNEHHIWSGNLDKDPSLSLLKYAIDRKGSQKTFDKLRFKILSFLWKSWIPVLGLLQYLVFWVYPLKLIKKKEKNKNKILNCTYSILFALGFYAFLNISMPQIFNLSNFLPALVLFFGAVEMVNFPHHIGMTVISNETEKKKLQPWEQVITTRSCYYPHFVSEFFCLNFNFHIEHHFFPLLPWFRLRKLRSEVKEALTGSYNEEIGIGWNLENRKKEIEDSFLSYKLLGKL